MSLNLTLVKLLSEQFTRCSVDLITGMEHAGLISERDFFNINMIVASFLITLCTLGMFFKVSLKTCCSSFGRIVEILGRYFDSINDSAIQDEEGDGGRSTSCFVNDPAVLHIANLSSRVTLNQLYEYIRKNCGKDQAKATRIFLAPDKKFKGKARAIVIISRTVLYSSGLFKEEIRNMGICREDIKEIKRIKTFLNQGKVWTTGCNTWKNYTSMSLCQAINDVSQNFGYISIDGGLYVSEKEEICTENQIDKMVKSSSSGGIERIILKSSDLGTANLAYNLCKRHTFRQYLYFSAVNDGVINSMRETFHHFVRKTSCVAVGSLSLSYEKSGQEERKEEIALFEEQVKTACSLRKSLLFRLQEKQSLEEDFVQVLRLYKHDLPACSLEMEGNHGEDVQLLIAEFDFYVVISGRHLSHGKYGWLKQLIVGRVISLNRVLLHSNAHVLQFWSDSKALSTYQDFKSNFLKKEIKYLHKEAVTDIGKHLKNTKKTLLCNPRVVHITFELLCSLVDIPPSRLAPLMKSNCEQFYKFAD